MDPSGREVRAILAAEVAVVRTFLSDRLEVVRGALTTLPDGEGWRATVVLFALFLLLAAALNRLLPLTFLAITRATGPAWSHLLLAIGLLVKPCLLEELFFRVLLPSPNIAFSSRTIGWSLISLLLFIAWHPIHAASWRTAALPVFTDPAFLLLAALLGLTCTAA